MICKYYLPINIYERILVFMSQSPALTNNLLPRAKRM